MSTEERELGMKLCPTCENAPGMPPLCPTCLHNRHLFFKQQGELLRKETIINFLHWIIAALIVVALLLFFAAKFNLNFIIST